MASGLSEYVSKNGETVEEAANLFMGVASGAGHAGAKTGCYCFLKPCEGDLKRESQADVISVEESQAECGLALGYSRLYTRLGPVSAMLFALPRSCMLDHWSVTLSRKQ